MGEKPDLDLCPSCGSQFPAGMLCPRCSPPPDLEELLRRSQGIADEHDHAIEILAAVHARWYRAWTETGGFSQEQAFELVRIMVATAMGGLRALGLSLPQQRRRKYRTQGHNQVTGSRACT